jgi:4'-phosphopantetheinyl transferase EntD
MTRSALSDTGDVLPRLAPPGVATAEIWGELNVAVSYEEEDQLVANAVDARRAQFHAGRACARSSLRQLGLPDGAILVNPDRSPRWPSGAIGSITHTQGFCGAMASATTTWRGLGVDAERSGAVTPDLWRDLFTTMELAWLDAVPALERNAFATVMFSAKEAYYKAQYPLTLSRLDFLDVEVTTLGTGRFEIRRLKPAALVPGKVEGRFWIGRGLVVTTTAIA